MVFLAILSTLSVAASVYYLIKLYLKFKPFFDVQKQTKHVNWAIIKLMNSNHSSELISDVNSVIVVYTKANFRLLQEIS